MVSIPHMGCMPYGLNMMRIRIPNSRVSIPHMGCMPYGPRTASARARSTYVSIPHMGCMPYGRQQRRLLLGVRCRFNPSYGLHALRAECSRSALSRIVVSIPHMGCMPYGRDPNVCHCHSRQVSIPHMGCMPYGRVSRSCATARLPFQSLIWVACPTGYNASGRPAAG